MLHFKSHGSIQFSLIRGTTLKRLAAFVTFLALAQCNNVSAQENLINEPPPLTSDLLGPEWRLNSHDLELPDEMEAVFGLSGVDTEAAEYEHALRGDLLSYVVARVDDSFVFPFDVPRQHVEVDGCRQAQIGTPGNLFMGNRASCLADGWYVVINYLPGDSGPSDPFAAPALAYLRQMLKGEFVPSDPVLEPVLSQFESPSDGSAPSTCASWLSGPLEAASVGVSDWQLQDFGFYESTTVGCQSQAVMFIEETANSYSQLGVRIAEIAWTDEEVAAILENTRSGIASSVPADSSDFKSTVDLYLDSGVGYVDPILADCDRVDRITVSNNAYGAMEVVMALTYCQITGKGNFNAIAVGQVPIPVAGGSIQLVAAEGAADAAVGTMLRNLNE